MRLTGPTLRDELRSAPWRSLRVFMPPAILAIALYAFYAIGGYGVHEAPPPPPKPGGIYGTVIDDDKRPVGGVSVTISFSNTREPVPDWAPVTDSDGHFYLKDLPAGKYILQATADGFDMQTQSTDVAAGETLRIKMPIYRRRSAPAPPKKQAPPRK